MPADPEPVPPSTAPTGALLLVLPDHRAIPLPDGEQVELGRETLVDEMDEALADYVDVSRHHAVIEYADGVITVTRTQAPADRAILAEGRPIAASGTMQAGERLRLGKHCWFKVVAS